jgi:hypothetical protein
MSTQGITFHGIEEAGGERGHWPGWTTAGRELERRPAGRLFPSEYHRLIRKERRAPWVVTAWLCAVAAVAYLLLYLLTR